MQESAALTPDQTKLCKEVHCPFYKGENVEGDPFPICLAVMSFIQDGLDPVYDKFKHLPAVAALEMTLIVFKAKHTHELGYIPKNCPKGLRVLLGIRELGGFNFPRY